MTPFHTFVVAALLLTHAASPLSTRHAENINDLDKKIASPEVTTMNNQTAADACAALATSPTWKSAKDCFTSFPYNPTLAANVQDTVTKVAQMYVFVDTAKNTPDKEFQPDYDLFEALNKTFAKKDYANDMEFQEAVSNAFIPLNDAHTGYSPDCYRNVIFSQPFYPVARVGKDGKTRLFVHGIGKGYPEYEKLMGAEITSIEGKPAVQYLWDWAQNNNVGLNKDAMTRFNRVTARSGYSEGKFKAYAGYFMMRAKLPEKETVNYTILPQGQSESVKMTIPWKVTLNGESFSDGPSYWKSNCLQAPEDSSDESATKSAERLVGAGSDREPLLLLNEGLISDKVPASLLAFEVNGADVTQRLKQEDDTKLKVVESEAPFVTKPHVTGPGLGFYTLESNEEVGVLLITTFSPPFGMTNLVRTALVRVFDFINKNNVKKLIIDLSGNGGGSSCLASEVVALLTPHLWESFPVVSNQYVKDERLSKLTMKLHMEGMRQNATQWDPKEWISAKTGKNFIGSDFLETRLRPHSNGKDPFPYTPLLRDDCRSPSDNPLRKITHNLKPEDLAVFSNGACGSACGRVHFHLTELDGVKNVVTGSFKDRKRSASGFPATQVLDYKYVVEDIKELGLTNDTDAFGLIPLQADLRFAVRESYSRSKKNVPVEFLFLPADVNLDWDSWTAMRPDRAWEQAAVELGWVPSWNKKVKKPESKSS